MWPEAEGERKEQTALARCSKPIKQKVTVITIQYRETVVEQQHLP